MIQSIKLQKKHYYQNIHWQIALYLNFIRKNEFPYQMKYWKSELKKALKLKNQYALAMNNAMRFGQQLTIFSPCL